jgi:hypothetical protein
MIRVKIFFTAVLLVSSLNPIFSQAAPADSTLGKITIHASAKIDSLERQQRGKSELKGFRIQIFLGPFVQAKAERTKFINMGTGLSAYMPQNPPDYSVRVGDFRTQLEAQKYLEQIKEVYPSAFIVPDRVEPPRFSKKSISTN